MSGNRKDEIPGVEESSSDPLDRENNIVRKPGRVAASIFYFLLPFVLILTIAGSLAPWPEDYGLRAKMAYFLEHKDEFNAVFIGSSRVARSMVPSVIDETMRAEGIDFHSFNLGIPAMESYEADHLLRAVVDAEPAKLKWIIVEADKWIVGTPEFGKFTHRSVHWHSLAETKNVVDFLGDREIPWLKHKLIVANHFLQWAWKWSSYGLGPDIVAALCMPAKGPDKYQADLTERQGYRPLESETEAEFEERRKSFLAKPGEFENIVMHLSAFEEQTRTKPESMQSFNPHAVKRQVELIREAGARPIFIGPATIMGAIPPPWILYETGVIPNLLCYTQPKEYPMLFDADHYFDLNHLNEKGARLFSEMLAKDMARLIKAQEAGR